MLMFFAILFGGGGLAAAPAVEKGAGKTKLELLKMVSHANPEPESLEAVYEFFDGEGKKTERWEIAWDSKGGRAVLTRILRRESSQFVLRLYALGPKYVTVVHEEDLTPDLTLGFSHVRKGRATTSAMRHPLLFIDVFQLLGDPLPPLRQMHDLITRKDAPFWLRGWTLWRYVSTVEFNGRKCLRLAQPFEAFYEMERGVVLAATDPGLDEDGNACSPVRYKYEDHKLFGGTWLPLVIQKTGIDGANEKLIWTRRLKPESVRVNHRIPDEKFVPRIPPGIEIENATGGLDEVPDAFPPEGLKTARHSREVSIEK
jgi:hypothetical protein